MKIIVILGGYGGFGSHLARYLDRKGYKLFVAGRSLQKAELFCEKLGNAEPFYMDREGDLNEPLRKIRPDLLIDAAGPFQGSDFHVVDTCIAQKIAYLDLADGRDFVCNIERKDETARAADIPVISGASTVPALSGAIVRHLAKDNCRVNAIEMAISASNKATVGASVCRAILSYVGKPIKLRVAGEQKFKYGWQDMKMAEYSLYPSGQKIRRLVALADVPDLDIMPFAVNGAPSVIFRAGTEFGYQNLILWCASWLVRFKLLKSLQPFSPVILFFQGLTRKLGSDISAMKVQLSCDQKGAVFEKCWTLIARDGDGPKIPTFAAAILAEKIAAGDLEAGAYHAGALLNLSDFEPLFGSYSMEHETREMAVVSLYQKVMGGDYDRLGTMVRELHGGRRDACYKGRATVTSGTNIFAKMVSRIFGFPETGDHQVTVHISANGQKEKWVRHFSGKPFHSNLKEGGGFLIERFGPLRFFFRLPLEESGLRMEMVKWKLAIIPIPKFLAPKSKAREWDEDGKFHFDVRLTLPLVGLMTHYRGWLEQISD